MSNGGMSNGGKSEGWRRYLPWRRGTTDTRPKAVEVGDPDLVDYGPCGCGHVPRLPSVVDHPWAAFAGYGDCVAWPEGALDPGAVVELGLGYPFRARIGDEVWTVETWNAPGVPGELGDPGDLAALRFVRGRLVSQQAGRVAAEILAVLRPEDLLDLPPGPGSLAALTEELAGDDAWTNETRSCGPLQAVRWAWFCGESIDWVLLWHGEAATHLLAHATRGLHHDEIAIGNRLLAPAERAVVMERAARCRPVEQFGLQDDVA